MDDPGRARDRASLESDDNTPFTPVEQAEVGKRLAEVEAYVRKTFDLTAAQLKEIGTGLEEIRKASTRIGRKDWTLLLIGQLVTMAIEPRVAETIAGMILHGPSQDRDRDDAGPPLRDSWAPASPTGVSPPRWQPVFRRSGDYPAVSSTSA